MLLFTVVFRFSEKAMFVREDLFDGDGDARRPWRYEMLLLLPLSEVQLSRLEFLRTTGAPRSSLISFKFVAESVFPASCLLMDPDDCWRWRRSWLLLRIRLSTLAILHDRNQLLNFWLAKRVSVMSKPGCLPHLGHTLLLYLFLFHVLRRIEKSSLTWTLPAVTTTMPWIIIRQFDINRNPSCWVSFRSYWATFWTVGDIAGRRVEWWSSSCFWSASPSQWWRTSQEITLFRCDFLTATAVSNR